MHPALGSLPDLSQLDPYKRVQSHLGMRDLWPLRTDGLCACGCGQELEGRRTRWATEACAAGAFEVYAIYTGRSESIRRALWERDRGVCASCGVQCSDGRRYLGPKAPEWEADHVVAVAEGGGGCYLDGYQTLCVPCHRERTAQQQRRWARARRRRLERKAGQQQLHLATTAGG